MSTTQAQSKKMTLSRQEKLNASQDGFRVLCSGEHSQIAIMTLGEGETSGEYGNEHPQSDQTMIVIDGGGKVLVEEETRDLQKGDVVFIPAGAKHQVFGPNKTLNVYAPKAYPEDYSE